ncbi:MAG: DUF5020 family protein [Bacteroidaceae bacterium]|nr:DUF5020 family protein [Bacteroidaceae bacterium]
MTRNLLLMASLLVSISTMAQLNVQLHYDLGHDLYGSQLSNRPRLTATVENFTPDKWGSTFFFIDADFGDNMVQSAYGEISREFRFWEAPFAAHIELDGGLNGKSGSFDNAYLIGPAWNWHNKDFSRTFSVQLMYKYLSHRERHGGTNHSAQLTGVWGLQLAKGLLTFSGFCDLWYDKGVNGHLILLSEPQFWVNLWKLPRINDNAKWSVGTEWEISNNFVWPTDGLNNRFYFIPTIAMKWTFGN